MKDKSGKEQPETKPVVAVANSNKQGGDQP